MKRFLKQAVDPANKLAAQTVLALRGDAPGLAIILMHGIQDSAQTLATDNFDPHHPLHLDDFERFVASLSACGYAFVNERQIKDGLPPAGKHVWLTFDDGYANNLAILPILERYDACATIFVAAGHVLAGKSFWWDVLWRESRARKIPPTEIRRRGAALKRLPYDEIERELTQDFGSAASKPSGEWDRPLTPDELNFLARSPSISIGNHTADHAILTELSHADALRQIVRCQDMVADVAGVRPTSLAYPNGFYTDAIADASSDLGLTVGVTTERRRRVPDLSSARMMTLPRISIQSDGTLDAQIAMLRASFKLSNELGAVRANLFEARHDAG